MLSAAVFKYLEPTDAEHHIHEEAFRADFKIKGPISAGYEEARQRQLGYDLGLAACIADGISKVSQAYDRVVSDMSLMQLPDSKGDRNAQNFALRVWRQWVELGFQTTCELTFAEKHERISNFHEWQSPLEEEMLNCCGAIDRMVSRSFRA